MESISFFLTLLNEVRVSHWMTNNYNMHVIAGDLYNELSLLVDAYAEIILSEGIVNTSVKRIELTVQFSKNNKSLIEILKYAIDECQYATEWPSIGRGTIDDIIKVLNRYIYKLKMI